MKHTEMPMILLRFFSTLAILLLVTTASATASDSTSATTGTPVIASTTTAAAVAVNEEIVVTSTATRAPIPINESPGAVDVVNIQRQRDYTAGIDISEFLARVPGLNIQHRYNYAQDTQISARGFGARAAFGIRGIRIYVDDIPVTIPDGQAQGALIPLAAVSQIEVLRGPWSLAYGNAAGGVIAATTIVPQDESATAIRTWRGQDGVAVESTQFSHRFNKNVAALVSWQQFQTDGFRAQSQTKREQLYAKADIRFSPRSQLALTLNKIDQPLSLDPLGLTATQIAENPRQAGTNAILFNTRKTIFHQQVGAVYTQAFDAISMKIIAYQGRRQVVQFLSIPIAAQQAATSAGGVIDLDRDFAGVGFRLSSDNNSDETNNEMDGSTNSLQWLVGVDIDEATDNRQGFENFVRTAAGTTRLGERGNLRRDEINRQRSADTFLQLSLPLHSPYSSDRNNNWRIYSALRQSRLKFSVADNYIRPGNRDDSGAREFSAVSPALGVVNSRGDKNNRSTFHASIGQGFETPTSAEQAYRADQQSGVNVDLRASRNRQIESGYRYFTPRTDIRATAFAIFSRDEIVAAATVAGRSSFQNAAGTSRQGIELSWRDALSQDWQASVSYTAIRARLTEQYVADVGPAARIIAAGNRLPAVPAQNFYADICWRCRAAGLSMTTELIARSAMFANDTNLAKAAGQMRLNTSLSYRAPVQIAGYVIELGATLRIDNLLAASGPGSVIVNDANARFFEPSPPRRMLLGLSGKLRF